MARSKILGFLPSKTASLAMPDNPSEALRLLRNFEESGRGWFWSTDRSGNLLYLSESMSRLLGGAGNSLAGTPFIQLFAPSENGSAVRERLPFILGRHANFEKLTLQTPDSGDWWEVAGTPQFDGSGNFSGYHGYAVDVTEQLQSSEYASQLAMYDPLTGLPNRLSMSQSLEACLATLNQPRKSCAVFLVDLDRFKQVNDSLGHPAGDALLKLVSERLLKIVGDREKVFRLGGDEFQIVLADCEDRGTLGTMAKEIIASLSQPYSVEGSRCIIGASIGIAIGPFDGRTSEELMRNADLALYAAKGNGRGCFRFFSNELLEAAEDRRVLEGDLRDALVKGELALFYQPIVCTKSNGVTGVEALIRWHHPIRGPISPELFIPIAEEANLIDAVGEWIIRKACDDAASWPAEIRVAVNVSPIQFANEALPRIVMSALANSGLAPNRLEIELTEGVFLSDSVETDSMFSMLKDIGVRLALDDFGTGYSSLGYLKTAPFDKIKIDQSFVRGATVVGSRNSAIIAAIVALANALEMETTAEGIESIDQLELTKRLGVSHVQGYVYSKAISSNELAGRLETGEWSLQPSGPAKHRSTRRSMYRKVGAILGSYYHSVLIRNLSETGALVEGLIEVPLGTQIIIDFGECQLTVATVRRSGKRQYGIEFSEPLVSDGVGGLCTSRRVSPYLLSKAGISPSDHLGETRVWDAGNSYSIGKLAQVFGLSLPGEAPRHSGAGDADGAEASRSGMETQAGHRLEGSNPLLNAGLLNPGGTPQTQLTRDELNRLKNAVEASQNPQLKNIIALVIMTGAKLHDVLGAQWEHFDLDAGTWDQKTSKAERIGPIRLSAEAIAVLRQLPRWDGCEHVIANPVTKKPYNSFFGSWDAARKRAGLRNISIHDLRGVSARSW